MRRIGRHDVSKRACGRWILLFQAADSAEKPARNRGKLPESMKIPC
jgi:hypothetical protein